MVLTCVICKTNAKRNPSLSYHSFPKCAEKRSQWFNILNRNILSWKSWHRICSNHFKADDYNLENNLRTLKCNSIPYIENNVQPEPIVVNSVSDTNDSDYENGFIITAYNTVALSPSTSCNINAKRQLNYSSSSQPEGGTPKKTKHSKFTRIGDVKENDFATPKRRRTNLKLFKTTISSLRCRNKHLVRRTRRLEKKVSSLKEIIDELTKSNLVSESATENLKIDIDFEYIYSGKENLLFEKWPLLISKLLTLMHTNIKDSNSKELLKKLCNQNSEIELDSKNTVVFALLNTLIIPTSKSYEIDKVTNSKRIVKTSIADARNSFLLLCTNTSNLYTQIQNKVDSYYEKKQTLQPLICIIGDEYIDSKEFFVYFFNTYYKIPSIVKAVDLCFKIFHVFNLKYPIESELVWTFLQNYIFMIFILNLM